MQTSKTSAILPRAIRLVLIALLLAALLVLLPSAAIHSYAAEILTLPMDESGGVPPHAWAYQGKTDYQDPSITVRMEHGRFRQTNWTSVYIKLANASQLRTLKAGPYGSTQEVQAATMARRVQAVLAIGGDFFCYHNYGYIVRQGVFYRNKPTGEHDVLIIDKEGNFDVLIRPDQQAMDQYDQARKAEIANAFTFGPAYIIKGQPIPPEDLTELKGDPGRAQRMAFCQLGELEYLAIYSEGPSDVNSVGLSIPQFAELVASFPGIQTAYNLDGGSSATIVFKNQKINGPIAQRGRSIGDIIFFASAWSGPEVEVSPAP